MLFGKPHRSQRILRKIGEFFHVESRVALKRGQCTHYVSDLSVTRTNTEPSCFVSKDYQINNELDSSLVRIHARPGRQWLNKVGHTESLCQSEQTHHLLRLQHRNIPIINASELVGTHRAVIRPLHKIENERDRKNRDDDHQPVPVLSQ